MTKTEIRVKMKNLYFVITVFTLVGCMNKPTKKEPLYVKNFNVEIRDTLVIGENFGRIINYKPSNDNLECLVSVIVENKYENGKIVKDTFSDGTLNPWFGVYAAQLGKTKIKWQVMEELLNDKVNDSILRIERTFFHFSKDVTVIPKVKNSNEN